MVHPYSESIKEVFLMLKINIMTSLKKNLIGKFLLIFILLNIQKLLFATPREPIQSLLIVHNVPNIPQTIELDPPDFVYKTTPIHPSFVFTNGFKREINAGTLHSQVQSSDLSKHLYIDFMYSIFNEERMGGVG